MTYKVSYRNLSLAPEDFQIFMNPMQQYRMQKAVEVISELIGIDPKRHLLVIQAELIEE